MLNQPSKEYCLAETIIDGYSVVFIPVDDILFDPSGLPSDLYLGFRIPGTPPFRFYVLKTSATIH